MSVQKYPFDIGSSVALHETTQEVVPKGAYTLLFVLVYTVPGSICSKYALNNNQNKELVTHFIRVSESSIKVSTVENLRYYHDLL